MPFVDNTLLPRFQDSLIAAGTTVYKQQDKALDAANKAFDKDEEDVLFYIPVTKSFIQQAVISLRLICESSDRNIMFYVQTMYNYHVFIETIWTICYSARYDIDRVKYHETSCALESLLGLQYEEIEDAVLHILETTHRCSSMIENFNSRLRPYLDERKFMSQKSLNLIQFYLNPKPFMRSKHERLVNKKPAEALTGKVHKPWLEMLGFTPWYKQAA